MLAGAETQASTAKTKAEAAAVAGEWKSTADPCNPRSTQLGTIVRRSLRQNPLSAGCPSKAALLHTSGFV